MLVEGQTIEHRQYGEGTFVCTVNDKIAKGVFGGEEKIFNMSYLEGQPKQPGHVRSPRQSNLFSGGRYTDFLEFLRKAATIRVQLPPQSVASFEKRYATITGESLEIPSEHASIITPTAKWGITLTVMFSDLSGLSLVPDDLTAFQYSPEVMGICDNDFVWELFSLGFRLGKNHKD